MPYYVGAPTSVLWNDSIERWAIYPRAYLPQSQGPSLRSDDCPENTNWPRDSTSNRVPTEIKCKSRDSVWRDYSTNCQSS